MMQAVVFETHGDPESVLQVRDIEPVQPRAGEIAVRMLASPINPSDLMFVQGDYTVRPQLPASPGFEGVGIVESSGGGLLGKLLVGRRVAVLNRRGGNWAERAVLPAKQVVPLSKDLPLDQATTFFVNPATAFILTRRVLNLSAGDWLLQTAAGSSLGKMVIRLGKRFGFKTLCVVRRPEQADELRQLGATAAIAFDPSQDDANRFVTEVQQLTGGGAKYAIDAVGGVTGSAVVRCLGNGGRLVVYGTLSGEALQVSPRDLIGNAASISGFWLGHWMESLKLAGKLKLVSTITNLIREGVLTTDIEARFKLDDVLQAVTAARQTGRSGKVILSIANER